MEENTKVIALYRMSEKKQKDSVGVHGIKEKIEGVNNINCLKNFREHFDGHLIVFGDNLKESKAQASKIADEFIEVKNHGNSASFVETLDYALELDSDTVVYFVEDDYIHRGDVSGLLLEGLERFDYVSLYDHPDKAGNNTNVIYTKSAHWMRTVSTTMTFAGRVDRLVYDKDIILNNLQSSQPNDHAMWINLARSGRTLGTTIPGFSTHGEVNFLSPVIEWQAYLQ